METLIDRQLRLSYAVIDYIRQQKLERKDRLQEIALFLHRNMSPVFADGVYSFMYSHSQGWIMNIAKITWMRIPSKGLQRCKRIVAHEVHEGISERIVSFMLTTSGVLSLTPSGLQAEVMDFVDNSQTKIEGLLYWLKEAQYYPFLPERERREKSIGVASWLYWNRYDSLEQAIQQIETNLSARGFFDQYKYH